MARFGSGIWLKPWYNQAFKNHHLARKVEELLKNFHELKKAHDWVSVVHGNAEGNYLSIELKNPVYSEAREYAKIIFVNKQKEGVLVTRGDVDNIEETDQFLAMKRAFGQTKVADIQKMLDVKRKTNGIGLPEELQYLQDLTKNLGVKLAILVQQEKDFKDACEVFNFNSNSDQNAHVEIICQKKANLTNSTLQIVEKQNKSGVTAALIPVQKSAFVKTFPPTGVHESNWSFLSNLILDDSPQHDLFAENLVAEIKLSKSTKLKTKERELRAFWITRFIHWMLENNKITDVGLVYGNLPVFSTPREKIVPNTLELEGCVKSDEASGTHKSTTSSASSTTQNTSPS